MTRKFFLHFLTHYRESKSYLAPDLTASLVNSRYLEELSLCILRVKNHELIKIDLQRFLVYLYGISSYTWQDSYYDYLRNFHIY